ATVSAREPDPNPDDNTDTVTPVPVEAPPASTADLVLTKSVDEPTPTVGDVVTFTLRVHNQGPANATEVRVIEPLPSGYSYVAATPSVGTYDSATGVWTLGALATGGRA
ncbi:DUF11 domain-containing protein, partial [Allochromatium palmeri]